MVIAFLENDLMANNWSYVARIFISFVYFVSLVPFLAILSTETS
jgi:hypothetical protein